MEDTLQDVTAIFNEFLIKISYGLEGFTYKDNNLGSSVLLINFIHANPSCNMKDIRKYLKVSPSKATRRVDKLVEMGFAQRSIGSKDHRSIEISLTPEGEELFNHYQEKRFRGLQDLTERFEQGEIKTFLSVLEFFIGMRDEFLKE